MTNQGPVKKKIFAWISGTSQELFAWLMYYSNTLSTKKERRDEAERK